jgi:CDP-glucose 4,6-dehydratase
MVKHHGRCGTNPVIDRAFWKGRRVFVSGHTGFKGSWLSLWLTELGAVVYGYAFIPPTEPSLYDLASVQELVHSTTGDIRDIEKMRISLCDASPEVVFHLAAQPLVRESYKNPVETYSTNVMGTVNLLESIRSCPTVKAVVNVTTDKCYENKEWHWGYREDETLGGYDPYSSSKACSELITAAYRNSFLNAEKGSGRNVALASARAGNVIGGGDWADDRLIPDFIRAMLRGVPTLIRNPAAIRPWQHVLEPLSGYLLLAQRLHESGDRYAGGWNFGPNDDDARPVVWLVQRLCDLWGEETRFEVEGGLHPHEANYLKLDCSKAKAELGWHPVWTLERSLASIVEWTKAYRDGGNVQEVCLRQIAEYDDSL